MIDELPASLRVEARGPVRIVTLDRADALNAVDAELHGGLARLWSHLDGDRDARAVVLTGAGRAFCAGGDLDWLRSQAGDETAARHTMDDAAAIISGMLHTRLPVVAAVNGPAVGLGCSLTVLSDIVLVSRAAWFADPHVAVGLAAGDGGVLLPSLTGMHLAKEYLLLGDRIPAEAAVRMGLANRVVTAAKLLDEAIALAERLAALPVAAVRATKSALNAQLLAQWASVSAALAGEYQAMLSAEHRRRLDELRG